MDKLLCEKLTMERAPGSHDVIHVSAPNVLSTSVAPTDQRVRRGEKEKKKEKKKRRETFLNLLA
jgi:hypothetical protein